MQVAIINDTDISKINEAIEILKSKNIDFKLYNESDSEDRLLGSLIESTKTEKRFDANYLKKALENEL